VHVGKLGVAEHDAVAPRHLDGVEHVGERDHARVRHVGVPVLPGVGEPDRLAVLDDVGQDHHLGNVGLLIDVRHLHLQLAEARGEIAQRAARELLAREADDAVLPERAGDRVDGFMRDRRREVDPLDGGAESLVGGNDVHLFAPTS
jgi:hypothetical protein